MTWLGLTPPASDGIPSRPAVMAIADHAGGARAAVSAGADIIDLGDMDLRDPALADIAAFLTDHPGVAYCAGDSGHGAAFTRRLAAARASDAVLICGDLAAAQTCRIPADRLVVLAQPGDIAAIRLAGYSAMVDADQPGSPRGRSPAPNATAPSTLAPSTLAPSSAESGLADPASVPGSVAAAALGSWLGASIVRTRHPREVRRGLDMVAVIAGILPPARAVRGLA